MPTAKFTERLERLMVATGAKSDSELARALGIQPPSVAAARKRQQIPGSWIEAIAEKTGTSSDWLLFGRGGTAPDVAPTPPPAASFTRSGIECVDTSDCRLAMIPMVEARLSAGTGSFETGANVERRYAFRTEFLLRKGQPSKMVLMRVAGDSMEPKIANDDVVLIDQSQVTPRAGDLCAVAVDDLVYIKMVDALPGRLILKSFNPDYAPLEIDTRGDLTEGIRIIGRAVWLGREL